MTKLVKIIELDGQIEILSGLRIGGGDAEMRIGGVDATLIRTSISREPYIPGSSLKGKIRSLLELTSGKMGQTMGKPLTLASAGDDLFATNIVKLFGESADEKSKSPVLGRLSFWDCRLSNAAAIKNANNDLLTEVKTENTINRIKGTAEHPRQMERVPAGALFELKLSLKVFAGDSEEELLSVVKKGLKLLEMDSLGSSGSRGYGKVKFKIKNVDLTDVNPCA